MAGRAQVLTDSGVFELDPIGHLYNNAYTNKLFLPADLYERPIFTMLIFPPFSPEKSIIVCRDYSGRFNVIELTSTTSVLYSLNSHAKLLYGSLARAPMDMDADVDLIYTTTSKVISHETGEAIRKSIHNAINKARYWPVEFDSKSEYLDGTTIYFVDEFNKCGWLPADVRPGTAKSLVSLGVILQKYLYNRVTEREVVDAATQVF